MSVDTYPYAEWTQWPEEDVREWAEEIAAAFTLEKFEAASLLEAMLSRAGHWRPPPEPICYPVKMTEEAEASYTAAFVEWHAARTQENKRPNSIAVEKEEQNRRLNQPWRRPEFTPPKWERKKVVGSGLSARTYWEVKRDGSGAPMTRWWDAKARSRMSKRPLQHEKVNMSAQMDEWLWRAGCVRLAHWEDRWMVPDSQKAERDGMWWYYEAVSARLAMAQRQIKIGEPERAAWHSLHAGRLFAEMELKASHDGFFKKQKLIHDRQVDYASARRKGQSDSERQEAWRKYRQQGYLPVEAGKLAGDELGVSERTIRRAFDDEYPAD